MKADGSSPKNMSKWPPTSSRQTGKAATAFSFGSTGTVSASAESGNRNVTEQITLAIIREFDVNEQWLRTGKGEMFLVKTRDEEIASFIGTLLKKDDDTFKKRLISALSKLEEQDWEVLEKMCNFMLESKKD